ncbi:MAG: acetyl-CoA carboxylase carboxyltransferase subunit alpha [Chitinivibrionales bacterium]
MKADLDFETPIAEIEKTIEKLRNLSNNNKGDFDEQIHELEKKLQQKRREIYAKLSPWQTVQVARHKNRPLFQDYAKNVFSDFIELHGDRAFSDDRALIGGFARLGDETVMLIGHNKGKTVEENVERNFGCARPEGYRKALRLMKLAEKFNIPVICLIDTQGAYPGMDAEERGQAEAIARNLMEMSHLQVPIICLVTGEGGSGGALGIGVGDVLLMLSNSVYSVISPEGCASILWRDAAYASTAAEAMKITATALKELGVVDDIITEPAGGAHNNYEQTFSAVAETLSKHLKSLKGVSRSKLTNKRFEKYSKIGMFNK